jgi:hypothetical protein
VTRRTLIAGIVLATVLLLGVGNAVVWGPVWRHFHVPAQNVEPAVLHHHRTLPADPVLAAVADMSMMTDHPLRGEAAVAAARCILKGEFAWPMLPVLPIGDTFEASQLEMGVPVQQVFIASLVVPDLLLRAHEHSPDPAFLAAAERYLRGFIAHDASVHFPTGLLLNSHAVANRAAVLARFWRHVRTGASDELAREVHGIVQRSAVLLARPSFFVATTNHGVMQNVALLQLSAAFPAVPGAEGWRQLALQRLEQQLPMYLSSEGAVLEHAAGYHFHGVVLSGYIVHLLRETGQPVPADLLQAHEAARTVLSTLQRADRSLPAIGNTYRYAWRLPELLQPDDKAWASGLRGRPTFTRILPVAGLAVWNDPDAVVGSSVQTVLHWGWFPRHGHASAQEMSLLIWSAGTDWSTNTGYWPNSDVAGFETATGWDGSSAPHVLGEAAQSARRTHILARLEQDGLRVLDLQRVVANGPRIRRQVIQWQANRWLVLDTYEDADRRPLRTLWTAAPETTQTMVGQRGFVFERVGSDLRFTVAVDGSDGVNATPLRGSLAPFGGWVAFDRKAAPAPGVDARLPAPEGWMLATLQLAHGAATVAPRARMVRYGGPEDWTLSLPTEKGPVTLTRQALSLTVEQRGASADATWAMTPGIAVDADLAAIEDADNILRQMYPRFSVAVEYRQRHSWALLAVWAAACVALCLLHRRGG